MMENRLEEKKKKVEEDRPEDTNPGAAQVLHG